MKTCISCFSAYDISFFNKKQSRCKTCEKVYKSAYRATNSSKISAGKKKHYNENKELVLNKCKEYRAANKGAISQRKKDYRKNNKDKFKADYLKNKEKYLHKQKKWYNMNKEKIRAERVNRRDYSKNKRLELRYKDMSSEKYEQMLQDQNHCCKICLKHKSDEAKSLHVDHCHTTGVVRGLLCGNCNRALGLFKDNIEVLLSAINYLKSYKNS
jgi:hypothetical protein